MVHGNPSLAGTKQNLVIILLVTESVARPNIHRFKGLVNVLRYIGSDNHNGIFGLCTDYRYTSRTGEQIGA